LSQVYYEPVFSKAPFLNGVTISHAGMHPESRLSLFAILLLIISFGNLYGIGLAL
jgi:hypothetical protein